MKPADISLVVLLAVIWGLALVMSRIALDELSPAPRLAGMIVVVCGIAVMLLSKRPRIQPEIA